MNKRKIIIVAVAVLILVAGKFGKDMLSESKKRNKPAESTRLTTVFTEVVKLEDQPIRLITTGSLEAKERMELYSEVQGMMLADNGRFKPGNRFKQGEVIVSVRMDDARARVVALRSGFERSLSAVMADIRIDFPEDYKAWSDYLKQINVNQNLPELPNVTNPTLKSFLTGREVYTNYYTVRNGEIGLSRFQIKAPFDGVLTSANADPGTVIRQGQLLGVFIKPGVYEVQASASAASIELLSVGQKAWIMVEESGQQYEGVISRINASIDPNTQMSDFFVEVRSNDLKDGQFIELEVAAETVSAAYEISRSAMADSRFAYIVKDGKLSRVPLNILHTSDKTAIVKGLSNGDVVLTKLPPTAYEGMNVEIYAED